MVWGEGEDGREWVVVGGRLRLCRRGLDGRTLPYFGVTCVFPLFALFLPLSLFSALFCASLPGFTALSLALCASFYRSLRSFTALSALCALLPLFPLFYRSFRSLRSFTALCALLGSWRAVT